MLAALVRRATSGIVTLFLVSGAVFALLHAAPGDMLTAGQNGSEGLRSLSPAREAELRALYHLDEPLPRQYVRWLTDVAHGDLGRSFQDHRPVREKIGERLSTTLGLNVLALLMMSLIALPVGSIAAWKAGSSWDRLTGAAAYALFAVPVFWAALLLQIFFSVKLGWLPLYGLTSDEFERLGIFGQLWDRATHVVLPVVCLSYGGLAYLSRFVRASLLESAFGESSRAARARGATATRLVLHHGTRQASVSLLTLAGFLLPALVGGSVIVETIFAIPGLGSLFIDAIGQRDVPVVMGLTLFSGAASVAGVVAADLGYVLADPRMRRVPG